MLRGRTRPGRLAAVDRYLLGFEEERLRASDPPGVSAVIVDVGIGEGPWTTLELATAVRALRADRRVVGTELDPARVARAQRESQGAIEVRRTTANALPLGAHEVPWVIRAMNVLRDMPEEAARLLRDQWLEALAPGGLLVEGSTDTEGAVACAQLTEKNRNGSLSAHLLFSTDFSRGFAPLLFRDWLPRAMRRGVKPGTPIGHFFAVWTAAWERSRGTASEPPTETFARSCEAAHRAGLSIRCIGPGMALATGV